MSSGNYMVDQGHTPDDPIYRCELCGRELEANEIADSQELCDRCMIEIHKEDAENCGRK